MLSAIGSRKSSKKQKKTVCRDLCKGHQQRRKVRRPFVLVYGILHTAYCVCLSSHVAHIRTLRCKELDVNAGVVVSIVDNVFGVLSFFLFPFVFLHKKTHYQTTTARGLFYVPQTGCSPSPSSLIGLLATKNPLTSLCTTTSHTTSVSMSSYPQPRRPRTSPNLQQHQSLPQHTIRIASSRSKESQMSVHSNLCVLVFAN